MNGLNSIITPPPPPPHAQLNFLPVKNYASHGQWTEPGSACVYPNSSSFGFNRGQADLVRSLRKKIIIFRRKYV
jgi:hypothetical protein